MAVTLSAAERLLVDRVLEFANAKPLPTPEAVEALFRTLPHVPGVWRTLLSLEPGDPAPAPDVFAKDQHQLRVWLEALVERDEEARQRAEAEILGRLSETVIEVASVAFDRGRLRIERAFRFDGVQGAVALGTALIYSEDSGVSKRLGRCGAPRCDRFNLSWEGRPRRHCSRAHATLADYHRAPERQRNRRKNLKLKRARVTRGK